jgi:putative ABC transport system permease protein
VIALLVLALRERWRAYGAIVLLCLSIGGLAAVGAAYPRSVADGIATAEIKAAPAEERLFSFSGSVEDNSGSAVAAATEPARKLPDYTVIYSASVSVMGFGSERSSLVYREDACSHVRLVAGRCPLGTGEVMVPAGRVQQDKKVDVGSRLMFVEAIKPDPKGPWVASDRGIAPVDVVGVYLPAEPGADYWGVRSSEEAAGVPLLLTLPETLNSVPHKLEVLTLTVVPHPQLLKTGDYGAILRSKLDPEVIKAAPGVRSLMTRIADKRRFVEIMTPAVVVPVLALGCWALFLLVSARLHRDRPEVGVQSLRGLPLPHRWWLAAGGAVVLAAIATPLGGLIGMLLTRGADGSSMTAAIRVLAVELVVIGVTAVGMLRVRPLDLLRRILPVSSRVPLTEIAVLTLAGASFVQMSSGDRTGLGTFAASLLALAVAVVAARVLPTLLRPVARTLLRRGSLTWGLALALGTRRASGRHLLALTAAAAALLTLVVGALDVATTSRRTQIDLTVGADRVLLVQSSAAQAMAVVKQVDPEGRYAMAVGRLSANGADILVADLSRADTMRWPEAAQAATALRPAGPAAIEVRGSKLVVTLDSDVKLIDMGLGPLPPGASYPRTGLMAVLELPGGEFTELDLGQLSPGTVGYPLALPPVCAEGCRLAGLSSTSFGMERGVLKLRAIEVDGTQVADGQGWHTPGTTGQWSVDPTGSPMGRPVYFLPPDVRDKLPVVYTRDIAGSANSSALALRGGQRAPLDAAMATEILPRVGRGSMLADLPSALRATIGFATPTHLEIWLSADAPKDLPQRLSDAGLSVVGDDGRAEALRRADETPPALTLRMQLAAAVAGMILLFGVVLFLSSADRRSAELAGLRLAGVGAATLRRASRTAYLAICLLGLLVGLAGAAVSWVAARAALPLVDGTPWLPPPSWPAPLPVVLVVAGVAAAFGVGTYFVFALGFGIEPRRNHPS